MEQTQPLTWPTRPGQARPDAPARTSLSFCGQGTCPLSLHVSQAVPTQAPAHPSWHRQCKAVCVPAQYAFVQAVDIENLDMGTIPLSVGGVKVYETSEDEGIFECPMTWGSNAVVRISARIMLGPLVLYLPVEIKNLQARPPPPCSLGLAPCIVGSWRLQPSTKTRADAGLWPLPQHAAWPHVQAGDLAVPR